MPNYPQLDNARGVWNMKEVYDAVMGGYWPNALSRGLFMGGEDGSGALNTIEYITISATGDVTDFGDLTLARGDGPSTGSFNRAICGGGNPKTNTIDYTSFMSTGNAADFGDLTVSRMKPGAVSNSTRGIWSGGATPATNNNTIDYITMASTGNAVDFGDLSSARASHGSAQSTTRGVFGGGKTPGVVNTIDFVEIATLGNATDFGDLSAGRQNAGGTSSSTRGVFIEGQTGGGGTQVTTVDYVTIASQGNAIDYGDTSVAGQGMGSLSNSVRGVSAGGSNPDGAVDVIEYFTIAVGGTAIDFGDLSAARSGMRQGASNAHGGLNDGYQGTRIRPMPQGAGAGQRGLFGAGYSDPAGATSNVDYFTISTLGNAANFGDATTGYARGGVASSTRSLAAGSHGPAYIDVIDYAEFAHTGNYADFGNLSTTRGYMEQGAASSTRGIFGGGNTAPSPGAYNILEYVTMATVGNVTDFGDLSATKSNGSSGVNSTTRGIWAGGYNPSPSDAATNVIEYVTIASTGDVTDFGDLTVARVYLWGSSNVTRGIWSGGNVPGNASKDEMDYVTIASTGNATDFGDLSTGSLEAEAVSNSTRMVHGGGAAGSHPSHLPVVNTMEYVTIASTGDAADFGDLTLKKAGQFAGSNGHGGLS